MESHTHLDALGDKAVSSDSRNSEKGLLLPDILPVSPRGATNARSHYWVSMAVFGFSLRKR